MEHIIPGSYFQNGRLMQKATLLVYLLYYNNNYLENRQRQATVTAIFVISVRYAVVERAPQI